MVLNYIWIAFFLIAFAIAVVRLVVFGDVEVFPAIMDSTFVSAKTAFEISLGLTGVLSLWLGVMKIGERGGLVALLARGLSPVFTKLFPEIPKGHPVVGNIFMNLAANMLGLDNAATPLGLKAMEGLQELNPKKDTASNAMIMFLVLNTSGLTVIPVSILVYRAQMGAAQPTDVFIPILLATFFSTLAGIIATSLYQRINLLNRVLLLTLGGVSLGVAGIMWGFSQLSREDMATVASTVANVVLFSVCALVESLGDVPWIYTMLAIFGLWGVVLRQYRRKELGTVDCILGLVYMAAAVMLLRGLFGLSVLAAVGVATGVLVAVLLVYALSLFWIVK